jgi:hypothetical protein
VFQIYVIRDNIKINLREIGWGVMDWIHLAQDRDQLRTLVNTFGFHKMLGHSCVAERLVTSEEGLGSMELVSQRTGVRYLVPLIGVETRDNVRNEEIHQ